MPTRENEARATEARSRAEASFTKEERAKEGAKAMLEYQASGREIRENMVKLRALRLAKEAAEEEAKVKGAKEKDTKNKDAKKEPAANRKPASSRKRA